MVALAPMVGSTTCGTMELVLFILVNRETIALKYGVESHLNNI